MSTTSNPYQNALLASNNADELKSRISALKAEKSSLTLDPEKPVEDEVEAMLKSEARIDAKIVQLERTLEILVRKLPELWRAAESYLWPLGVAATEETHALREEGRALAQRVYMPLTRGNPVGQGFFQTVGYVDAIALDENCVSIFRERYEQNLASVSDHFTRLVEFLDSLPEQVKAVRSIFTNLEAAAQELERWFPSE